MSIPLAGTTGYLFNRLGRFGYGLNQINAFQAVTVPNFVSSIMTQFDGLRTVVADVPALQRAEQDYCASAAYQSFQADARNTLLQMVGADVAARGTTVQLALQELIEQMRAASATVKACTVGSSQTVISGSQGNGVLIVATKRGDGLVQENSVAETLKVYCDTDSQTGGAALGKETFTVLAGADSQSRYDWNWPLASGAATQVASVTATESAGTNLLTNSNFSAFTSNLPNKWVAAVGVAGTDFLQSTAQGFTGASSLQLVGGSTLTSLTQTFGDTGGTAGTLQPDRSYAVNLWLKVDVVPAAGVLTVDLVDGNGSVIADDQGVANSFTVTLSGLTTSWAAKNAVFRTPKVLPAVQKLRVRISTALSGGTNLFVDDATFSGTTPIYAGGPSVAVVSGNSKWIKGDGWNLTVTNDRGGSTYGATFQTLFDRLFGMRSLGLLLPSSLTPTIGDSLITGSSGSGSGS